MQGQVTHFVEELEAWVTKASFAQVLILSSGNASFRNDGQMQGYAHMLALQCKDDLRMLPLQAAPVLGE